MIKVIAFDCGGVVFSNAWQDPQFAQIPRMLGLTQEEVTETFYTYWPEFKTGKMTEDEFWAKFLAKARRKISLKEIKDFYRTCIISHPEVFNLVRKLSKNYTLFTINNEAKEWMDIRVKKFNLRRYFKDFIASGYVGVAKPDLEIFKILIKRANVLPKEIFFTDDQEKSIGPARSLGINAVLFKSATQLKKELVTLGVKID